MDFLSKGILIIPFTDVCKLPDVNDIDALSGGVLDHMTNLTLVCILVYCILVGIYYNFTKSSMTTNNFTLILFISLFVGSIDEKSVNMYTIKW